MTHNIHAAPLGLPLSEAPCLVVYGHGWGQSGEAFRPLAEALAGRACHVLVDFPGFGLSPPPPEDWDTADYADAMAEIIEPLRAKAARIIWCGHSFGGRVGIQLAARHPDAIDGMFLIAAAGLPRRRPWPQRLAMWGRVRIFKALKFLSPLLGMDIDKLRGRFGSADYRSAGKLRGLFLRVIREDLSAQARAIKCPVALVYGENDSETPPEIGERLQKLIPDASLSVIPDQDHYSVLAEGKHVVAKRLADFIGKISA